MPVLLSTYVPGATANSPPSACHRHECRRSSSLLRVRPDAIVQRRETTPSVRHLWPVDLLPTTTQSQNAVSVRIQIPPPRSAPCANPCSRLLAALTGGKDATRVRRALHFHVAGVEMRRGWRGSSSSTLAEVVPGVDVRGWEAACWSGVGERQGSGEVSEVMGTALGPRMVSTSQAGQS